jgi:small nuclear ribonucleoprotein (snRNP)-like protein
MNLVIDECEEMAHGEEQNNTGNGGNARKSY